MQKDSVLVIKKKKNPDNLKYVAFVKYDGYQVGGTGHELRFRWSFCTTKKLIN